MIAFRIGFNSRPHTIEETAARFCMAPHEVERVIKQLLGSGESDV